jgi:diacylglycerol kinase (ATP)
MAEVISLRPIGARVTVDGQCFEGDVSLVAIANTPSYGGGMFIAPEADPTDGLLDVAIIGAMSRLRLLRVFPHVFRGTHARFQEVTLLQGKRVRVESERPMPVVLDGDVGANTPFEVVVRPGALNAVQGGR